MDTISRYSFAVCMGIVVFLSLIPIIPQILSGEGLRGAANPQYMEMYYVPMMREVVDGHPLMGNPYFFEHRDAIAPAFIAPFWLAAVPLMVGLPLAASLAFNFILWSIIFSVILYAFFRRLDLSAPWSAFSAVIVYAHMYGQLLRPVSMQTVQPTFILYMLALLIWWESPRNIWRSFFLAGSAAFAIYAYTYQLQIIAVSLALSFAYLIYKRDGARLKSAISVGLWTSVLCIPFLAVTYAQLHDLNYVDTVTRIGLGYTHWPAGEAFKSGIRILSLVALALFMWRTIADRKDKHTEFLIQFIFLGGAIEVISLANIMTGLDLETASHAARYVIVWLVVGTMIAANYLFKWRQHIFLLERWKRGLLLLLVFLVISSNLGYFGSMQGMFDFSQWVGLTKNDAAALPVLKWLDAHESEPSVIWTTPRSPLSLLIPTYTKHYVLFAVQGALQIVSTSETRERYLLASSLSELDAKKIHDDADAFGLNMYRGDFFYTINRWYRTCTALHLSALGINCGTLQDPDEIYAPLYLEMYEQYKAIPVHMSAELEKFHVAYILKDLRIDTDFHPERLKNAQQVYSDGRFEVYELR